MGLDMFAYRIKAGVLSPEDQVDFGSKLSKDGERLPEVTELAYWSKFNALHGWMERLYRSKVASSEYFNCDTVRLEKQDLEVLESLALAKALVPVGGFFFGDSTTPFSDEDRDDVLTFVKDAKQALADGDAVAYDSWW